MTQGTHEVVEVVTWGMGVTGLGYGYRLLGLSQVRHLSV